MPFALLKYGLSSAYPAEVDLPAPKDLKPHYDVVIIGGEGMVLLLLTTWRSITVLLMLRYWKKAIWREAIPPVIQRLFVLIT